MCKWKREKRLMETTKERKIRLNHENKRKCDARTRNKENHHKTAAWSQKENNNSTIPRRPLSAITINEDEYYMLQNFHNKMDNIQYNFYYICNKRIPLIKLVKEMYCYHCHAEKKLSKKFSAKNNINSGNVLEELKGLTEVEEILIVQVFTVMSVYWLQEGQNGYKENVINFPQNI